MVNGGRLPVILTWENTRMKISSRLILVSGRLVTIPGNYGPASGEQIVVKTDNAYRDYYGKKAGKTTEKTGAMI